MAEYFVGPVMEKVIDKCFAHFKDDDIWPYDTQEVLKNLREIHPEIQAVVSSYKQAQIEDVAFIKWLWKLRDVVDEADDLLDELEYMRKHEEQVRNSNTTEEAMNFVQGAVNKYPDLVKLEVVVLKLDKVSAKVSAFRHLLKDTEQNQDELHQNIEIGSMPTNDLFGRSKEMEFVRNWLRNPCQTESTNSADLYSKISLLSAVGDRGMGKTTLLQHAYDDEEVTKEFDVKMWICVPTNFNDRTVIASMLKSHEKHMSNEELLEKLQSSLKSQVLSKRFLLVLDNIWEADEAKWKNVLVPLQYGSSGSKILITTPLYAVALKFAKMIIKSREILFLKDLEGDHCLRLFNKYAFAGVQNPDHEFRSIAIKMVEKFSGCPLAAKVIGGILSTYIDKRYWKKVLNTNLGNIKPGHNYLLSLLKLSYRYLPKYLQNCFAFCCMFPQDHEFDKDDLVRMWIALGFIQSSIIQGETLEDTGRKYFDILVHKSFFEEFLTYDDLVYYKMHDLSHELAQSVSTQECARVVNNKELSFYPKTIRHLSVNIYRSGRHNSSVVAALRKIEKFKNLSSLFLCFSNSVNNPENAISEILKASKNIRLLVIHAKNISGIPETIGCLIHLRYLKVECSGWLKLPRCISYLYHFQFIISKKLWLNEVDNNCWQADNNLTNCQLLTDEVIIKDPSVFPRIISSLHLLTIEENDELVLFSSETEQWFLQHTSSLSELYFLDLHSLQALPSSLESFSSLNTLRVYNVSQLKLLPNPPASLVKLELYILESLECLPSSLSTISSLTELRLIDILLLKSLPDFPSSLKELVLENLESLHCQLPSSLSTISSLMKLSLKNIPLLISLPDLPCSLFTLLLEDLENVDCLPSCLHTSLKTLRIIQVPRLLELPDLPCSLKTLELRELESLQYLPSSLPTSLMTLRISEVPQLQELPDLPASIYCLDIEDCNL